jgi:hypothetical protein
MRPWMLVVLVSACVKAPAWFDDCDCGDDICVQDSDGLTCAAVPQECEALFADKCDGGKVEVDCVVALCGDFVGEWDFEMDCHKGSGTLRRYADCTLVPDTPPSE